MNLVTEKLHDELLRSSFGLLASLIQSYTRKQELLQLVDQIHASIHENTKRLDVYQVIIVDVESHLYKEFLLKINPLREHYLTSLVHKNSLAEESLLLSNCFL